MLVMDLVVGRGTIDVAVGDTTTTFSAPPSTHLVPCEQFYEMPRIGEVGLSLLV